MPTPREHVDDVELRHLAAIVAASDDAIISKDRDAIIRSWNPGAERLYGWMAEEVVGRSISILIPPHRAGEERVVLERILTGERLDHYETERVCRDGTMVLVSLTISPVTNDSGEIVAASVISRDITQQRAAEVERERLLAELALESERAYEAEHAVALTLQRSLLPHELPQLGGLQIAARYLPAGPNLNVGGDWYDVVAGSDGSVIAAIGDVAGHGLNAAATMGQLRTIVRAFAFDGRTSASLLDRLNRFVDATGGLGMATLGLVRFIPEGGVIEIARAGHPSPFVRRADGSTEWLTGPAGTPIGTVARAEYAQTSHAIEPGDTVLLFTDGLVERRDESFDVGIARLTKVIEAAPDDLEELCDAILEQLIPAEAERRDDIALLALRVGLEDRASFSFSEPGRPAVLASLRRRLLHWLDTGDFSSQKLHDIVTACNEAASNVIEHAYRDRDGPVEVTGARAEDGSIELVVRDSGEWRAQRTTGGGRGRKIMAALCDAVDFSHDAAGTVVTMRHQAPGGRNG